MNLSPPPRRLSVIADRLLAWLKWPTAAASLVILPGAGFAFVELLVRIAGAPSTMTLFLIGFVAYGFVWWKWFRRSPVTILLTLEHELTHALFALATFHRVTGLRVTVSRGGRMSFVGEGNWLITISPYFVPTLSMLLLSAWLPPLPDFLLRPLIGASFAYHLTSALRETHPGQTDLRRVGLPFCALFLPAANLLAAGIVLGFCHDSVAGLYQFLRDATGFTGRLFGVG